MKNLPKRIFLNLGPTPDRNDFSKNGNVTWSNSRKNKYDIEYVLCKKEEKPMNEEQVRNRFYNILRKAFKDDYPRYGSKKSIAECMKELSELSELEFSSFRGVGANIITVAIIELEKYGLTFKPLEKVKEKIGGTKHEK
jgi:hypothetical protein